jgi:peptidoglycan/xylan/chitin deacetylase (PgdA/CDA1 family)
MRPAICRSDTRQMMLRALARRPRRLLRRTTSFFTGSAVVLLYHRVYDSDFDPLLLTVGRKHFDQQMAHLRRHYAVLSLQELRDALTRGSLPRGAVAVTFDDGYGDNLRNARPALERHRIPATVFVTTGYIEAGREFWWDELGRILFFAPQLPACLSLNVGGSTRQWALESASRMTVEERLADRGWSILCEDNPTALHRAYREIQPLLSLAPSEERDRMLMDLREQTKCAAPHRVEDLAMTRDELRALVQGGLIAVGAHTITHPVLSTLTREAAAHEIRQSKHDLEEILGATVSSFAYPYGYRGAYTPQNMADVRAAGLADAYSNFGGVVRPKADRHELNRTLVRDWTLDEFARAVRRAFGD